MPTHGSYKYSDGSEYTGEWNDDGKRHGLGYMTFSDGSSYDGRFENGLCNGYGVMMFLDKSRYQGEFTSGKFHGLGIFQRSDGMMFEGEFQDGKINGLGVVTYADGTHGLPRNEGVFKEHRFVRQDTCPLVIQKATQAAQSAFAQKLT
ncbi:PREDICTED: MORN repeat-containing protein 4-like [Priapulus caudatus]|uniref:MORN repeat-containing protein 4-like n=1 Tax=Priapulus caudatus TaxID=37621 RepID=A0ABM1DS34_PRICU|nr:PREDICTED: MORN repeat-containing protein 4-like [Priapulus caudatus]XP_014662755.1 PREDICTED: MORN repeat-containing protein 4-like [Priapulus caudatus]XP_014662757.1 PREDICTED: MORN repeat-containing protein 4-like [Priapulus caudatus]XP_014662758.1 PREDICTED: MORN repeat-containing protein 4-like [Priapulus caudatus]